MRIFIDDRDNLMNFLFLIFTIFFRNNFISHFNFLMMQRNPLFKYILVCDDMMCVNKNLEEILFDFIIIDVEIKYFLLR